MEWIPEPYDLSKQPAVQSTFRTVPDPSLPGNFPRVAKWSPDGSVVLAQCENRSFHIFDSSSEQYEAAPSILNTMAASHMPTRVFPQAAPILDFLWFPTASPHDPASFCFVASVRECPVKLLDASDGRLRASYRIVDHRERQIAPHSLAFNLTAQKLYCGFEDAIEVFDLSRPGDGARIHTTPSKKSKDGLKGIISALAFSPSYSPDESFYAAGSFTPTQGNIAMFSDAQDEPCMYLGRGPRAGVTQLQFNPMKPHILYAAYRGSGSGSIYSWDIRSNVDTPLEILKGPSYSGMEKTNQRMRFNIDSVGRMLSIGDQVGNISIFELDDAAETQAVDMEYDDITDARIRKPKLHFQAHDDAIGSVAFHPLKSNLISASGSRHFTETDRTQVDEDKSTDSDSSDDSDTHTPSKRLVAMQMKHLQPVTFDSKLKIWDFAVHEALDSS